MTMNKDQLITLSDLQEFENRITRKLEVIEASNRGSNNLNKENYLRTSGVKALLKISDNTLKTMRESGELPFSYIGATYYYPEAEILEILRKNTINKVFK